MTLVTRIDLTRLDQITKELEPRAEKILNDVAFQVETNAKMLSPLDTGALRSSINVNPPEHMKRVISDQVNYGIYQELGTYKMAAHPFMTPAVEKVRATFNKMWEALFK